MTFSLDPVEGDGLERVVLPAGELEVGRERTADVVVDARGVSRRHAFLQTTSLGLLVEDAGSTNGTWVNGVRIEGRVRLDAGDRLRLGSATFVVRAQQSRARPATPPAPPPPRSATAAATSHGRVALGRTLLVGVAVQTVVTLAVAAIQQFSDTRGLAPWLTAPVVGLVVTLGIIVRQTMEGPQVAVDQSLTSVPGGVRPGPRLRSTPVVAVIVVMLVVGVGGTAATVGVRYAVQWVTGDERGVERLAGAASTSDGGITVTVVSVEHTAHFTRVAVRVDNGRSTSVKYDFGRPTLSGVDGTTLDMDPLRSDGGEVGPGQRRSSVLVFPGHLPDAGTDATLTLDLFTFGDFDAPDQIVVRGIAITPLAAAVPTRGATSASPRQG